MKRVIKNQNKMKKTMYIVFGVFALALFGITMSNPSYAEEGLIIDDALDAVAQQITSGSGGFEKVEEEKLIQPVEEDEGEDIVEPEATPDEEIEEGEGEDSQDLDDINLEGNNDDKEEKEDENQENEEVLNELENGENETINEEHKETGEITEESEEIEESKNEDNDTNQENHGVSDENTNNGQENILPQQNEEPKFIEMNKDENIEIMSETSATLLPGQDFNKKIKSLATGAAVTSYYTADTLITSIQRENEIPSGVTTGLISTASSNNEVIAWYSGGILYYYSQADIIYLNSDSSYMFSCMKGLTILDLIGFDTSKVTNMSYMFSFCDNLIKVDLSNFDTNKVTNMYEMFDDCGKLETIYVSSGFVVNANVSVGYMFYNAKNLMGGAGTKWNSSFTDGTYAKIDKEGQVGYFTDPKSITVNFKVNGNIYETQIKKYGDKILPINFPENEGAGFKKWVIESGEEYDFNNEIITKYTELYAIFDNGNTAILLPGQDFNKKIKSLAMGATVTSYSTADTLITGIQRATTIPSGVTTGLISTPYSDNEVIVWYKNGILYYYSQADIIYLNSDSSYMFSYMKGLTSLDLHNFDTSIVENMRSMFYYCENLTSLNLSNFDTRNVTDMGYMFGYCDLLETIYVGIGFITDQVVNSESMYYNDNKLKGGNGTEYSVYATNTDKTKAKVDTKTQSGYFTDSNEITVKFNVFGEFYLDQVVAKGEMVSRPTNPEVEGYEFKGRYTDVNFSSEFDFSRGIEKYTEIYAKMDGDEAILLPGTDFNVQIKKLANGEGISQVTTEDLKINTIVRTGSRELGVTEKIISTSYSKYPVYAWYKNVGGTGTIYYYTEASKIYMNQDSSNMFYYMKGLRELDVSKFDSSRVENMSSMFSCKQGTTDGYGIENLTGLETWDTSKVEDMSYMFARCSNYRRIDISSFNTTNLKKMSNMFIECTNLDTLIMDNKDFTNLYYWSQGILDYNSWDKKPKIKMISARNWKVPDSLYKGSERFVNTSESPTKEPTEQCEILVQH